jgi:hypothetical protein
MAGLNLKVGGFGGVSTTEPANYGPADSYDSVTAAAFGPGASVQVDGMGALSPSQPVGMAVVVGVLSVAALVFIRYSLPN